MTSQYERIGALADEQAGSALVAALELGGERLDLAELVETQQHLITALGDPDTAEFVTSGRSASAGDLARLALAHLAESDGPRVQKALDAVDGRRERDPVAALAIGALVLYAFSAELKIERDPQKGWTFRFHKRPMKDSTVGRILSDLYATFIGGGAP